MTGNYYKITQVIRSNTSREYIFLVVQFCMMLPRRFRDHSRGARACVKLKYQHPRSKLSSPSEERIIRRVSRARRITPGPSSRVRDYCRSSDSSSISPRRPFYVNQVLHASAYATIMHVSTSSLLDQEIS